MTAGYLLDTNIVSYWFDEENNQERPLVLAHIESLPASTPLMTSAIVLGELEAGCRLASKDKQAALKELPRFLRTRLPRVLAVARATATTYGDLKARLFPYAPKKGRRQLAGSQLAKPIRPKSLGADDNDLWLAAQALERNIVLVTHDAINRIRTIAPELRVEDWAASSSTA